MKEPVFHVRRKERQIAVRGRAWRLLRVDVEPAQAPRGPERVTAIETQGGERVGFREPLQREA